MPLTNEATTEANRLIERAKEVLRQPVGTSEELFKLAKALKGIQKFNLARRILELASKRKPATLERKILQQLASCTEKDPDLPLDRRYQKALKIIEAPLHEAEQFLISSVTGDSSELGDLFCRDLNGGFHDEPGDAFTAWRCGQRSIVVIILGLTWEEILGIDTHILYHFLLINVGRKLLD